jgi:1,2-phenylacetyl-CoA epoxidase catalytic subunit
VSDEIRMLADRHHQALEHWRQHNFPDYPKLAEVWPKFFPKDEPFCLCAKLADDIPAAIEIGDDVGRPKALRPSELAPDAAQHLLGQIRAQASTEFGSIQQHQMTLLRAQEPQDQAWALRVMAEELRHGYQMLHLLTSSDWSSVSDAKPDDIVEEILSMQTGGHVLAAFNLEFDSFLDNVVFAAFIDRVGKYQLTMQKISAYKPYAASMPPMLREEAFHLAAGVIPLRRWVEHAARGDGYIDMSAIQKAVHKWFGRGLEMFGDERGGQTNVKFGLKDMANRESQDLYIQECTKLLDDLNERYVRARFPEKTREAADEVFERVMAGSTVEGLSRDELLRLPDRRFFRRRGEPAFQMVGTHGETFTDVERYVAHVLASLPEAYRASIDVKHWAEMQRAVVDGTKTLKEAMASMPRLARQAGGCPCGKSVRWVVDATGGAAGGERLNP